MFASCLRGGVVVIAAWVTTARMLTWQVADSHFGAGTQCSACQFVGIRQGVSGRRRERSWHCSLEGVSWWSAPSRFFVCWWYTLTVASDRGKGWNRLLLSRVGPHLVRILVRDLWCWRASPAVRHGTGRRDRPGASTPVQRGHEIAGQSLLVREGPPSWRWLCDRRVIRRGPAGVRPDGTLSRAVRRRSASERSGAASSEIGCAGAHDAVGASCGPCSCDASRVRLLCDCTRWEGGHVPWGRCSATHGRSTTVSPSGTIRESSVTIRGHQETVRFTDRRLRDELVHIARERIPDIRAQPCPPEEARDFAE